MEIDNAKIGKKVIGSDPSLVNASIQTTYTHPDFLEGTKEYRLEDVGPFFVHVLKEETEKASGIFIRPLKFGQFLYKLNIGNIEKGTI